MYNSPNLFEFTVYYGGIPQRADNPPWAGGFTWSKDKDDRDWPEFCKSSSGFFLLGFPKHKAATRASSKSRLTPVLAAMMMIFLEMLNPLGMRGIIISLTPDDVVVYK